MVQPCQEGACDVQVMSCGQPLLVIELTLACKVASTEPARECGVCYRRVCHLLLLLTTHCFMVAGLVAGAVGSDVWADSIVVVAASNHSCWASLVALPSMRSQQSLCMLSTPGCFVAGTRLLSVKWHCTSGCGEMRWSTARVQCALWHSGTVGWGPARPGLCESLRVCPNWVKSR